MSLLFESSPGNADGGQRLRPGMKRALANVAWLVAGRVLATGLGLVVAVLLARHLGKEKFGTLNFATSFVALFGFLSALGLGGIVVREIVKQPSRRDEILGSAFALHLAGGCLAAGAAIVAIRLVRPDDALAQLLVTVVAGGAVLQSTNAVTHFFKSEVKAKYVVASTTFALVVASVASLILVARGATVAAFAWVRLGQAGLLAVALLVAYRAYGLSVAAWRPRLRRALGLLRDGWPLMMSALAVGVYMKIDQIMLGEMMGDDAVGVYAAATRLSTAWYFVPMAITSSVFPAILRSRERDSKLYHSRLQKLYDLVTWLALAVAVGTAFLSGWLVDLLYGAEYHEAAAVLAVHIWCGVFSFQGLASGQWIVAENLQKYRSLYVLTGAAINVAANYLLIPVYGPTGAALATIACQAWAATLAPVFLARTRTATWMLVKAFLLPFRFLLTYLAKKPTVR